MTTRRSVLRAIAAAGAVLPLATLHAARAQQDYPNRPIRMIVPFPPVVRSTPWRASSRTSFRRARAQAVVENRPGAGSTLGSKAAAAADPDGYTLLFGSSGSLAVAPALYAKMHMEPLKMFAPIASVALLPHVFVVAPSCR